MKKLLFLLLLPLWISAQVSTGQEQDFDYGIRNLSSQTVATPDTLVTRGADGTYGHTSASLLPLSTATTNALELKSNKDSGLLSGGIISVNADPTKWNLAEGVGFVTNSLTGVVTPVTWDTQNALTTPYLATSVATYVLIDSSGGTVLQNTDPTQQQYRTHIYLGKLAHTTFTTILFAVSEPSRMFDVSGQVSDLNRFLGSGNVDGNIITYNGANLNINSSAGMTYRAGANYSIDRNSPSITTEPIFTAGTFRNKFRNGSGGWSAVNTSVIDPNNYDNGSGILQVVPNNKWTVKVLWRFGGTGTIHCDYGQAVYDNKVDALAAAGRAAVAEDPETKRDASRRAWLVVQQGATVLNDLTKSEFIPADKLGERSSGSSSTATFQTTYNNSVTPHITTTVGGGALAIKQGSGSDTDAILVGQNGAGTNTFSVAGNGDIIGGTYNGKTPEDTANKSDSYTVSSTTTYPNTKALVDGLSTKQNTLTNPITGTGTTNYLPKFGTSSSITDSNILDDGATVFFGGTKSIFAQGNNNSILNVNNSYVDSSVITNGISINNSVTHQSGGTVSGLARGLWSRMEIGATNTQNWGSGIIAMSAESIGASGATGTIDRLTGLSLAVGNNASGLTVNNSYGIVTAYLGANQLTTNTAGIALSQITNSTNSTQLLLGTTTIPTGNYAVYDTTGYDSVFSGTLSSSAVKINTTPSTATGTPPLLTWNSSTKAVESIPYSPQIKITTAVSITTATLGGGLSQQGRNVVIDNGVNAINLTVDGTDGFCSSYLKHGTGAITFVQGSGRTMVQVDGTAVLNGAVGSTAVISSVGTTDYLMISNK